MIKKKIMIIVICSFVLVAGTGITYSLFSSNSNLIANQKIAQFIFEATKTDSIELPITDLNPGDEPVNYTFQVANNLEQKKSDVTINYQVIVKTYHFMPLDIKLYKEGIDEPILICDDKFSRDEATNQLLCNSDVQKMIHNDKITDKYTLELTFPKKYNSEVYANLVDYIDIDINSWQSTGK
jgi:hypothetical protein